METATPIVLSPEWTSAPSALQSRMKQLQDRVEECKRRIEGQNNSVAEVCRGALELQGQAATLKNTLDSMAQRLQALGVGAAAAAEAVVPAPAPVAPAPQAAEPALPATEVSLKSGTPEQDFGGGLLRCIPYLLIAAAGIGYGLTSRTVEAAAAVPAANASAARPSAEASGVLEAPASADPENEALRLVYEYKLPGRDQDMLDLVGTREDALGPSPWQMECDESNRCDVSFISRPGGDEKPVYEFAVDLGAKTVTPSSATTERLLADAG
jgi:hypothetical protein